ncbi:MAG TPA: flagellar hook capping FlgD N-terminal domain-containing protein [Polyangiaceae bacterium]|jgi:flagellar basal-body rod modification protein FlgD
MTSPINSTSSLTGASSTSSSDTASAAASAATQTLGQDAFLKLLMAQLQNQDPLQPTDGTEFVTQLAQFSQVEQAVAQSTTLGNISTQLQNMSNSNASDLIGKTVTASSAGMQWGGTFAATSNVTLAGAAQTVTATIQDSQGNTVRTLNLGPQGAGPLSISWDGKDDSGTATATGSYAVNVTATDGNGQPVNVSQTVTGVVSGVSFSQGYPALNLSNGVVVPASQLQSVANTPATPTTP